jgi:hypothetical protein
LIDKLPIKELLYFSTEYAPYNFDYLDVDSEVDLIGWKKTKYSIIRSSQVQIIILNISL